MHNPSEISKLEKASTSSHETNNKRTLTDLTPRDTLLAEERDQSTTTFTPAISATISLPATSQVTPTKSATISLLATSPAQDVPSPQPVVIPLPSSALGNSQFSSSLFAPSAAAAKQPFVPNKVQNHVDCDGLKKITMPIDTTVGNERCCSHIKLEFNSDAATKKFRDNFIQHSKQSASKVNLSILYAVSLKSANILNVDFFPNSKPDRETRNDNNRGMAVLAEFKKHVNIDAIPQVFFDYNIREEISADSAKQLLREKLMPLNLLKVKKYIDSDFDGTKSFSAVKLQFANSEDAEQLRKQFLAYCDKYIPNSVLNINILFSMTDETMLDVVVFPNSKLDFSLQENGYKNMGEAILSELNQLMNIRRIPSVYIDCYASKSNEISDDAALSLLQTTASSPSLKKR